MPFPPKQKERIRKKELRPSHFPSLAIVVLLPDLLVSELHYAGFFNVAHATAPISAGTISANGFTLRAQKGSGQYS